MSWATNQPTNYSTRPTQERKGRVVVVPCGHQRLTGVDTITMSISSCASGDTIHIHSLGACSPTSLSGPAYFDGFPKGLQRNWRGCREGMRGTGTKELLLCSVLLLLSVKKPQKLWNMPPWYHSVKLHVQEGWSIQATLILPCRVASSMNYTVCFIRTPLNFCVFGKFPCHSSYSLATLQKRSYSISLFIR